MLYRYMLPAESFENLEARLADFIRGVHQVENGIRVLLGNHGEQLDPYHIRALIDAARIVAVVRKAAWRQYEADCPEMILEDDREDVVERLNPVPFSGHPLAGIPPTEEYAWEDLAWIRWVNAVLGGHIEGDLSAVMDVPPEDDG